MSLEVRMLENICKAIDSHAERCDFPPTAVALHPRAREELDWNEIRGLPIVHDEDLDRWRFRIICDRPVVVGRAKTAGRVGEHVEVQLA